MEALQFVPESPASGSRHRAENIGSVQDMPLDLFQLLLTGIRVEIYGLGLDYGVQF